MSDQNQYTEDKYPIARLKEHIRMRPGMYIGKLEMVLLLMTVFISFKRGAGQLYR
jgi:DNA gyrase/topoisomerase IV subunit B